MESAGADKGFFQQPPALLNQFYEDATYQRCFKLFLPAELRAQIEPEVAKLGWEVLTDRIFIWISDAERNKPFIKGSGRFVADGYDTPYGPFSRMQDGAACMLHLHLTTPSLASKLSETERKVFENAYRHLISRDPKSAWTSGQWMTERPGGSDVSLSETTAVHRPNDTGALASKEEGIPLGPWSINGFKWFSSATDANMTILLARTPAGRLSTFYAPMRRHDPSALNESGNPDPHGKCLNGVRIQRLKNKLGTRSVPTAELVLEDMRGWIIGEENRGIQEISALLHVTRIHTTSQSVGYAGRGLAIARAYARAREVGAGRGARMRLTDSSLHMKTLARMTAEYRRLMLLHMFAVYVLGLSEHPTENGADITPALQALTPPPRHLVPLLRVLTSLAKAYICSSALTLLFACMEAIGGVGYLLNEEQEYLNIARLYRDCAVMPIWEGTTDVVSTDFIRALKRPETGVQSLDALDCAIQQAFAFKADDSKYQTVVQRWADAKDRIAKGSQADLVGKARDILWTVAEVLTAALLHVDANNDGDAAEREILQRYLEDKFSVKERIGVTTREELERDFAIVYGEDKLKAASNLNIPLPMASYIQIEPMVHPEGSGINFGAHVSHVDLVDLSVLAEAFYKHHVLVIKDQGHLSPRAQYEFTQRLNYAATSPSDPSNKQNTKSFLLSPELNTVPHQPQVQIIGNGFVREHEGAKDLKLRYPHHRSSHATVIADEDNLEFTRFYRWHIDAALYDDAPPIATTILAVRLPRRRMQTVRYDDGTGDELPVPLGTIAFASGEIMYDLLSEGDKAFARCTKVEYAAHPYLWMGSAKSHPTGLGVVSEGRELDDDELPPVDPASVQILPMCWQNPVTKRLALQVHSSVARRLYLANGEIIDDLQRKLRQLHLFVRSRVDDPSHETLVTEQLARPHHQGGLLVALQRPADNHPFPDGVDNVVEESPTLRALRDVFALISLDLVDQITVVDSLPFLRQADKRRMGNDPKAYLSAREEHHAVFLEAVVAKRPDVVLCMWQQEPWMAELRGDCIRTARELAGAKTEGSKPELHVVYANAVKQIQDAVPDLGSGKYSWDQRDKTLYNKLVTCKWTGHLNDAALCLRAVQRRQRDPVGIHDSTGASGDMAIRTVGLVMCLAMKLSGSAKMELRSHPGKGLFSDRQSRCSKPNSTTGVSCQRFRRLLTMAQDIEGLLGILAGYSEKEEATEAKTERDIGSDSVGVQIEAAMESKALEEALSEAMRKLEALKLS
ncbi:very-long-chain acyl- dehydrogenase [Trichoderma arundinaceum]|uniref:Very-long-chain acyl-dehydrogenase n=1 Tax=Trichoderma arundinaceum TaxID=490622 RepID=A0A395NVD4_TRIAR|nr:very-long-chain acyl- dehydrogenase [Trichoderma arundinaceum]